MFGKYDKNVSTIKWPSLTAKIGKRRKKSFIGSAPDLKIQDFQDCLKVITQLPILIFVVFTLNQMKLKSRTHFPK